MKMQYLLLFSACLALSFALPAQQFKKTIGDKTGGLNTTRSGPQGTYGLDLSSPFSTDDFKCLKGYGYSFAIVRAYQSTGRPDPYASESISNARAAGIDYVDVYMFPCPTCGDPAGQVQSMVDALGGSDYGQIWLDIEGPQYWMSSETDNREFFDKLLSAANQYKTTGVYTSDSQWGPIMGDYDGGSSAQLWYAHYDDDPSFDDFNPFGGWNRPAIKQYEGDASVCGADIDKDWY